MIWGYPPFRKPLKLWLNPNKNRGKHGEHMGLNWTNLTNYNWTLQDREWWFSAEKWDLRRNKCIQMWNYKEHGDFRKGFNRWKLGLWNMTCPGRPGLHIPKVISHISRCIHFCCLTPYQSPYKPQQFTWNPIKPLWNPMKSPESAMKSIIKSH